MFSSNYLASMMLLVGASLCPLLIIGLLFWFLILAVIKIKNLLVKRQQSRSTPCHNCVYFSKHEELRCAVNPCQVLTKNAVNCRDFEQKTGYQVYDYKLRSNSLIEHRSPR